MTVTSRTRLQVALKPFLLSPFSLSLLSPGDQVIRKVNKQLAILDVDEPVSQLHKCSFQFRDEPHAFLCLSNDAIIRHQVTPPPRRPGSFILHLFVCFRPLISPVHWLQAQPSVREPSRVVLSDGACWTIIGVEAVEFTFNQGPACVQTPVSPFPVITALEVGPDQTLLRPTGPD